MGEVRVSRCRGEAVWEIDTADVLAGDKIMCWLSDATAAVTVTGWADREIDLTRHGLGVSVRREFKGVGAPWWADDMLAADLGGRVFIAARTGTGSNRETKDGERS